MEKKGEAPDTHRGHEPGTSLVFRRRGLLFILTYIGAFSISLSGSTVDEAIYSALHPGKLSIALFTLTFSLVGIAGFLFRLWAAGYIGSDTVHSENVKTATLVTSGPYAHTRNPLYFGLLLMALGFLPELSPPGFLFLLLTNTLLIAYLIRVEQRAHSDARGDEYKAYQKSVPLLFPTLRRRITASNSSFSLREGLKTEAMNIFVFSTLVASSTLNGEYFFLSVAALFITGVVLRGVLRS